MTISITPQKRAAQEALMAKRGDTEPDCLTGAAREMYLSMTAEELQALADGQSASAPTQQMT